MAINSHTTNVYFSTYTNLNWQPVLTDNQYKDIIIESLRFLVNNSRIKLFGFVIMPNHIHLLWQIVSEHKLENVQRDFLKYTAQKIKLKMIDKSDTILDNLVVNAKDRRVQIWERNGLSFMLNDSKTMIQKLTYIHNNPVQDKWALSNNTEDYFYSTARYYKTEFDNFGMLSYISSILW